MAEGRKERFAQRAADAAAAKAVNAKRKTGERARRDARMLARVQAGRLPYTPDVMSWLSRKLGKPATKITAADVKTLTK